ncbi:MAG: ATP-binding cassette domain-containing protein [Anaerolineae bacterium]|nr:ATP-binding cassette domain-containing protein [Anaerolineae bacterium]NUQ06780.1 ATP-binding cassette domain-containing protein [Anaerolineae bacterium]
MNSPAPAAEKRATGSANREALMQVRGLKKYFPITAGLIVQRQVGAVKAVDDVSFEVYKGETLGLVGESGCGKSTTGRTVLQLYRPTAGSVVFEGKELTTMSDGGLRATRQRMQMIFQDPYASLNPRMSVGNIVSEPLRIHKVLSNKKEQQEYVEQLLIKVGLNPYFINRYPHEFSGGQRQRIGIARALALRPSFIVADEPISALDVSIQAQVVNLLEELQDELNLTYLFIAHDLSMVRHICDRVAVMYLGKIVEVGSVDNVYDNPLHPYTQALLSAVPVPDPVKEKARQRVILTGDVPSPARPPLGCNFNTRCPVALAGVCYEEPDPPLIELEPGHWVACHRAV